jgi:hypothetical protein
MKKNEIKIKIREVEKKSNFEKKTKKKGEKLAKKKTKKKRKKKKEGDKNHCGLLL